MSDMLPLARVKFSPAMAAGVAVATVVGCPLQATAGPVSNAVTTPAQQSSPAFQRAIAWGILKARIIRWTQLERDWDGNDGTAPTSAVAANAKAFIAVAEAAGTPVPSPFVAGDGEVGFRWAKNNNFASVSFVDGHIIGYVRTEQSIIRVDEPFDPKSPRVATLTHALTAFA